MITVKAKGTRHVAIVSYLQRGEIGCLQSDIGWIIIELTVQESVFRASPLSRVSGSGCCNGTHQYNPGSTLPYSFIAPLDFHPNSFKQARNLVYEINQALWSRRMCRSESIVVSLKSLERAVSEVMQGYLNRDKAGLTLADAYRPLVHLQSYLFAHSSTG